MTGPDDAFLAPDDALRGFDDDSDVESGTGGGERPGTDDVERPNPAEPLSRTPVARPAPSRADPRGSSRRRVRPAAGQRPVGRAGPA
jgi:hypothetical protein